MKHKYIIKCAKCKNKLGETRGQVEEGSIPSYTQSMDI